VALTLAPGYSYNVGSWLWILDLVLGYGFRSGLVCWFLNEAIFSLPLGIVQSSNMKYRIHNHSHRSLTHVHQYLTHLQEGKIILENGR
jgi:hypothetical protein